ncbi:MAG: TPM domain-containing protein [Clostridia bacterium]|nr:TPM domain-containing protein [Clostridia bacterium]
MRKLRTIIIAIIAAMLVLTQMTAIAADKIFEVPETISVNDYSGVIQPSTKTYIQSRNEVLMNETQSKIIFVAVPTTGNERIDEYAKRLYKAWSVAYIGDNSSVFILLATDDMQYWPIVGSHIESAMTPDIVDDYLLRFLEPDFANRDFDAAIRKTYDALADWYSDTFNTALANTPNTNADSDNAKSGVSFVSVIGIVLKILLVLALVLIIALIYIRRQIRLKQIAQRKRMRMAKIQKYKNTEPMEQYSYYYSSVRDDDDI